MVIDPSDGNSNEQARRARALLVPFPRANNHFGIYPEHFIPLTTRK